MFPIRDENPTHHFPIVTVLLILANAVIFFYEASLGPAAEGLIRNYGILPAQITGQAVVTTAVPPYLTLFTSMFLHGGLMHLVGNLWFLWLFGDNLEDFLGRFTYVIFYLVTGLAAGAVHVFLNPSSEIPTIGASGAISGVLGGYLVLYPKIRIKTLLVLGWIIDVIYVPAIFFLGLWFVMQLAGGAGGDVGVAFGAHVGGFVAGVLLMLVFSSRKPRESLHHRYDSRRAARFH